MYEVPLEKQIASSSLIVEGEVISNKSIWNNSNTLIYTISVVQVYKTFKGTAQENIEILTLGGTVGNDRLVVNPALKLKKGEIGIFMLHESTVNISQNSLIFNQFYEVVSLSQGFYKYILEDNKVINPFSSYKGISQNFYPKIELISKQKLKVKKTFDIDQSIITTIKGNQKSAAITISKISPLKASAGTKTVLTITGDGFGTEKGDVFFLNANDGGATYQNVPPSEILSWNDSKIEVYIPSHAGTGTVLIQDGNSGSHRSSEELEITFAILNGLVGDKNYIPSLVDISGQGGYVWHMTNNFDANLLAKESFKRALNSWVCTSTVNWELGEVTATNVSERDGENVIRFDIDDELPEGVKGLCLNYQLICTDGAGESATTEMDLVLDNETNWNFGPESPSTNQTDFESVVLHELGHAHQLSHVMDANDIMYYAISNGVEKRTIKDNDKAGASFVIEKSTLEGACSFNAMTEKQCLDSDNDGVHDDTDQCPNTPTGETADTNGCSDSQIDDDNDGVTNDKDTCPDTPAGETVDVNGCSDSQLDDDNDGVMNNVDDCPNTPSGETVDTNGCSSSQTDGDNDGVYDNKDLCPNTPSGQSVNSSGCATSQLDTDNDGITDDNDNCSNTPSGEAVNSSGCSTSQLDTDSDGVSDDNDNCSNTPSGETVDSNGCSISQTDGDNDGVTDDKDTCPNTPNGQSVNSSGCATSQLDTDNDGITDDKDNCSNTPSGEGVNSSGCSTSQLDTDNDGITDDKDICPNTPSGQSVNSNGCSTSQLDTDSDGVKDDKDTCPNTPNGQSVNSNGCSTSQLDTDNDGVTDDKDTCSDTPNDQSVNSNGCSTSQLDTDSDGVSDDKDTCSNTPAGETVDVKGCSNSQLDDDNDGVMNDKDSCPGTIEEQTVNIEGCSDSQTLGIEDEKLDKSIKFYPNPVSNNLSIQSESIFIEKVEIYSYLGVKIDVIDSEFEHIQTDNLSKGIYIIKIYSEKGSTTRRLIKQ